MSAADPLLVETIERLLASACTFDEIAQAEQTGISNDVWRALSDAGFPWVGIEESSGGSGGTLADLAAILRAVGRFAAPAPVAETALGGWLLARAGIALPGGALSVVEQPAELVDGRLRVDGIGAWARHAERIVVVAGSAICSLRADQVELVVGNNLAGEARDRVLGELSLDDVEHAVVDGFDAWQATRQRGALSRVIMAAGALQAMAQMTVDYTSERRQFGKPVATFQAVQHHLVVAAQSAVRATMAADVAVRAAALGGGRFEVAAARVIVDDAIGLGTRAAHQAHGAMGVTGEYALHHLTRRLWSWRHEWGTSKQWRGELGQAVAAAGADQMYSLVTG